MTRFQAEHPVAERVDDPREVGNQGGEVRSPWLTTREACVYLRYTGKHCLRSLYRFLDEKGIPTARRGGTILIARADLDTALGVRHRRSR